MLLKLFQNTQGQKQDSRSFQGGSLTQTPKPGRRHAQENYRTIPLRNFDANPYTSPWKRRHYGDCEEIVPVRRWGDGEMNRRSTEGL